MVVEDVELPYVQTGLRVVEINLNRVRIDADHPEHVIRVDVHVVIVDLLGEIGRSSRTGEDIESNKSKRALVLAAVCANELAFAESHVCLVSQGCGNAGAGVSSGPAAADVRQTNKSVEVCDLRRIVYIG